MNVSVSLPVELVERIDGQARKRHLARSRVIEQWLWQAEARIAERALAAEAGADYRSQTAEEQAEDEAIAAASSRALRDLEVDEERPAARKTGRRQVRRRR